ncbi:hypothetical protein OY671_010935, partial [Metschnikowia pulcherrima]
MSRPLSFRVPAEQAHRLTSMALGAAPSARRSAPEPASTQRVAGIVFPNPVGMAPGFDKNAQVPDAVSRSGFGFTEIGTVTPRPQAGNPAPRSFRSVEDRAVINRMGFNSEGAEAVAARSRHRPAGSIVGGNSGKNKETPEAQASDDYRAAFRLIAPQVDYTALNVSSPN